MDMSRFSARRNEMTNDEDDAIEQNGVPPGKLATADGIDYLHRVDDSKPVRQFVVDGHPPLIIRAAKWEELVDLRHHVLRQGLPRESAIFPGDDLASSRHFGVFEGDTTIGCATFHRNQFESEPAWQLRGMATDGALRSKGVGRELLGFAEEVLRGDESSIRRMWANARVPAIRFYQSMGWLIVSEEFDVPTAGPHRRITKLLF
jgi:GNAT superfamily N-acetyltransferase